MGIFSRLFGGSRQKDKSYVRAWVEKHKSELCHSNDLSPKNLFVALMYGLSCFGKNDLVGTIPSDFEELGIDVTGQFSSDGALFELGCYMFFHIDLWLFKNEPDRREEISYTFIDEFIELFSQALGSKKIPMLFEERLSGYGELVRTGTDTERYHHHLSQLILLTKNTQLPEAYDFDNSTLMLTIEDVHVKVDLANWETIILPAMIENLENYCNLTK